MSTGQLCSPKHRKSRAGASGSSFQQGFDAPSTSGFQRAFQGVMNTLSPTKKRGGNRSNDRGPRVAISGFGNNDAKYANVSDNTIG